MIKAIKLLGVLVFTVVLFLVVASALFYHLIRSGEVQRFLVNEIEAKTGLKARLSQPELELGRILGIGFRDVVLFDPDAPHVAITAERISARVALQPLFERNVVLHGLRLHRPSARIVRDREGRITLLDKLLNLPFLKENAGQFGLDLRSISIEDGVVEFEDQQAAAGLRTMRLRDIDLQLGQMRGQGPGEFVKQLTKPKPAQPRGAALEFDLKSVLEAENKETNLRARGNVILPRDALELRRAWWNVQLQLADLPAELLEQYAGGRWPLKSLRGALAPQLQIEGSPADQLRIKGNVSFKQLSIAAPEIFAASLPPGDGRAEFDLDWKQQRLGIPFFDFRSEDLKLTIHGNIRSIGAPDPHIQLNLSAQELPLAVLQKYFPVERIGSPQVATLVAGLQTGRLQLKKAGVNGHLSEIRDLAQSAAKGLVWFDAELRDVAVKFNGEGYLPAQAVQGLISLDKGVLGVKDLSGNYGQSRFTDVDGSYRLLPEGRDIIDIHAVGDVDLAELLGQMKLGLFSAPATKLAVGEWGGRGRIDLHVRRAAESVPEFEGNVTLDSARLRFNDISLTEIKGDLALSSSEIRAQRLSALLSNSPIQIQLALSNYGTESGNFDLGVESGGVKIGTVARLLLSAGSPEDPGLVRGAVRYYGSLAPKGDRKFTGSLDLDKVQLLVDPLLQPLRELSGRIKIDEAGIDFQNLTGLLVGAPASFTGRWRYAESPQLLFDFSAPSLDIPYLISQIDPEAHEFYAKLQAQGKVALAKGRIKSFDFADFKSDVTIDRRVWRLFNPTMRASGGAIMGTATVADKPDTLGLSAEPKIQGVPVQTFLSWFDLATTEMTGKLNLTGKVETIGKDGAERKQNLNGAFNLRIEDGIIRRMRVIVQILNLLDLSRWFTLQLPDLTKDGIRFRSITGDFKITKGVYETQNLIVDSNDLRMTGAGRIDVPKDEVDFVVAVRPFAGIDTAINYIPLIGRGLAAIKNSFLVAAFSIKGSIDDPTIAPAPLSTLSEVFFGVLGIPKNLIPFGGEEKKEELPKDPPKKPADRKEPQASK
jgi:AsmA-like C-terminal region/AsmA family/Protein of unknown function